MSRIVFEDVRASALTPAQVEALWDIHRQYVVRSRASFEAGLARSDDVLLYREGAGGPIRGFAVFNVVDVELGGRTHVVILARWGFLDRAIRNKSPMQWASIRAWLRQKRRRPFDPVYWMFTASTVSSYMALLRTSGEPWPNRRGPTPPLYAELLDKTMTALGEEGWDAASGRLIRNGEVRYLEGVVARDVTPADPDIRFYQETNPRQDRGDSLACITRMTVPAILAYWHRMLHRRLFGKRKRR